MNGWLERKPLGDTLKEGLRLQLHESEIGLLIDDNDKVAVTCAHKQEAALVAGHMEVLLHP